MTDEKPPVDGGERVIQRACPHCAAVSRVSGDFCPICGRSYVRRKRLSGRLRRAIYAAVVILILGAAGGAVAMKVNHDQRVERQRQEARSARIGAEKATALKRQEAAAKVQIDKLGRKTLESGLEKGVKSYARKLAAEGTLEGPILGANCTPISGGSSRDLSSSTGTYSCTAITKREADGTTSGYRFAGNIDFARFEYSYHLGE
jgi:anti-sigma factor RsiW